MNSIGIRKRALGCMVLLLTIFSPFMAAWADEAAAPAEAAAVDPCKPTATFSTDILSQYIFRGAANSKDSAVIQPAATLTWYGFSANIWGNFDTSRHSSNPFLQTGINDGHSKWSETDFTVSYTKEICPNFSVLLGNVYYGLNPPLQSAFGEDEDELFGGVSYTLPWFTVAFTVYGEVMHSVDEWFELDLTKSIPVDCLCKGATVDLGASFGYLILNHDNNLLSLDPTVPLGSYSDFHTCQLTADIKFPIGKYLTIAPKVGLWLPLTSAADDFLEANSLDTNSTHFYGGINATVTF
ncbi:conserved exported hypothetical protein [Syntrophobacter sp. SbD1]|nr:conserved exported hypothetical protein [Syntrophobacter sp. SbD1]